MEQHCIRQTELPGASRLFADLLYRFDRVSEFYSHAPYDLDSFAEAAKFDFPADRRSAIVSALREQNPGNPSVEKLAEPGTLAVVTGQQVGLFGGPCYTVFKALAAIRLAATLTEHGRPAVPVFWLATEDHDLEEINRAWLFDCRQKPAALLTSSKNPKSGPVGPIPIQEPPLEELRRLLEGHPYGAEAFQLAAECYGPGETFGSAFRKLVERLFGHYGMIFLDPLDPSIRKLAAPFLVQSLERSGELARAVEARSHALTEAGYHAQVHVEGNASLLFLLENGKRVSLKRTENGFNDIPEAVLRERGESLSPNALLRPVMQDYLLPTVAYLGGPAELAYMAQSQPLYEKLLGRMPVMMHRASFTLLDNRTSKLLKKYQLSLRDVLVPEVTLREKVAARLIPEDVAGTFESAKHTVEKELDRLGAGLRGFDPGLEKAFATSRAKMLFQLGKIERKTAREAMRRSEKASLDAAYLHDLLYPHRHMQERLYGVLPFLARHGMDLVDRIYEAVRPDCPDHQVLKVE